ncbi:MAG: AAA family ATPase [bacterium]
MSTKQLSLWSLLLPGLEKVLYDNNPWWRGEKIFGLPGMKRWAFQPALERIEKGIQNRKAPAVVLRGPRQIGKTTLLLQIIDYLLDHNVSPHRIFRLQFDELPELGRLKDVSVILELCRWFSENILKKSFNQAACDGEQAFIFLDEVQNLSDWAIQIKHLVDINPVRVLVTGSSALRIEAGRDSLAGRVTTLEMGPLFLREIGELRGFGQSQPFLPFNGLSVLKQKDFWQELRSFGEKESEFRQRAFLAFSQRGGYPVAQANADVSWEQIADQLNETVVKRVIQHDLRMGPKGKKRDEHLLEEVFRLACRYIGQSPNQAFYLNEIRLAMNANIGWQRIFAYLRFLDGSLLIRLIEPLELRLKRKRGASKLCLCDHALRAAWLQEIIPLSPEELEKQPHLCDLSGRIAESVAGYFLSNIIGLDIAHFPQRNAEPEIDFVLTIGEQRIPVEVKFRRQIDYRDTIGLRSFIEKAHYNAPFGLLITLTDAVASDDPRIISVPLSTMLLLR